MFRTDIDKQNQYKFQFQTHKISPLPIKSEKFWGHHILEGTMSSLIDFRASGRSGRRHLVISIRTAVRAGAGVRIYEVGM